MPSIRSALLAAALGLSFFVLAASQAPAVERLSLSHVRQVADGPPTLRVYLDAIHSDGEPLRGLDASSLQATLGPEQAQVRSLEPFGTTGEGTAYIFLVDISRSLTEAQFSGIRDALEAWILDFTAKDWGAVIAFGESSRLVVDFTSDWRQLRDGLDSLGPTDGLTLFHQALDDAIELSRRRDPGMPGRRVVVVLTDGLDEGSGLNLDDILARLREHPVPIHAIGYSSIKPESRRREYLDVLQRLASNSGGTFFEAQQTDFARSYTAIRKAIRRVWVAEIVCPTCVADGSIHRLQTNLSIGNRVLSRGADLRLLPMAPPRVPPPPMEPPSTAPPSQEPAPAGEPGEPVPAEGTPGEAPGGVEGASTGAAGWWQAVPWWVYALTALLLALLVGMLSSFGGSKGGASSGDELPPLGGGAPEEASKEEGRTPAPTLSPDDPSLKEVPPIPLGLGGLGSVRPRNVRLVVVRGSRKGKEYRLLLEERAVVGARSSCDCILTDEEGIAAEQFELSQKDGQVYLRNLAVTNPTRMGGHAVQEPRRLKSNDLVGTSEMILRVILDP